MACLLAFIAVFEDRIVLPSYLQVIGRMHPLVLHFPIVLFLVFIAYKLFFEKGIKDVAVAKRTGDWLLLMAAFTSVVTALMGLFLAKEPGYDPDALQWHKWSGIVATAIIVIWYALNERSKSFTVNLLLSTAGVVAIVMTGHLGAGITHGEDFILAPIEKEQKGPDVPLEDAFVYEHMVHPILQQKCIGCHSSKKAKGELVMETETMLLKGGRSGALWDTGADLGLLLRRIHLPIDQKKHMPPAGKPQLTDDEIAILTEWIRKGHDFKLKVIDLPVKDSLYMAALQIFSSSENEHYDFPAADEKKVAKLNTQNRVVRPLALESPAISVSFFNASLFKPEQLKELLAIKQQLVELNLDKMPVKDEDVKTISQLTSLRTLNLSFTSITGASVRELLALKQLKHLSLSGVPLKEAEVKQLASLPELTKLYIWSTGLQPNVVAALKQSMKQVILETGFRGDTVIMQLTPPILENEEPVITSTLPLKLKHYIKGAAIRYTTDGSAPDSLSSAVYDDKVTLDKQVTIKAKAFKPGWISSDVLETTFFKDTYRPDSAIAVTPPDKYYKGNGAVTLIDGKKGDNNYRTEKWLGYRDNKMEMLLSYHQPAMVSSITLSTVIDISAYLMPPASIEVWGGNEPGKLQLLGRVNPEQPRATTLTYMKAYDVTFKPESVRFIKLVATPVNKLPAWHPGKGDKGWLFADEIFVN